MEENKLQYNLKFLMEEKNISATQVARETNLPLSSIKKIRNGSNPNPTIATLLPIARYLEIDLEDLVDSNLISQASIKTKKKNKRVSSIEIPVIKWDEILHWPNISNHNEFICTELQVNEFSFALRVYADDWNQFTAGSLLLIDPLLHPSHRDYAIVYRQGMSQPLLKQILVEEEKIYLQSVSISNNIDQLTGEHKILGTAIENRRSLKRNAFPRKMTNSNIEIQLDFEKNQSEYYQYVR